MKIRIDSASVTNPSHGASSATHAGAGIRSFGGGGSSNGSSGSFSSAIKGHYAITIPLMSLLLRLILLMDLLGPHGLDPPPPATQPSAEAKLSTGGSVKLGSSSFTASGSSASGTMSGFSSTTLGSASVSSSARLQHNSFAESLEWLVAD